MTDAQRRSKVLPSTFDVPGAPHDEGVAAITKSVTAAREHERPRRVAVFVAHGMGQQIPFQTLDQVAVGLRKQAGGSSKANAVSVKHGEQWLQRIELTLGGGAPETHVYEAYWAPLTEGKIDVRGVVAFLAGAGANGVGNANGRFKRWLFGEYRGFDSPVRIVLYLLVALATVAALVAMNSVIVVVAAARSLLGPATPWLTNALFADLTTTFDAVVLVLAALGISIALSSVLRRANAPRPLRLAWGGASVLVLVATLITVVSGGLVLGVLLYGHVKLGPGSGAIWPQLLGSESVDAFDGAFDTIAWWLLIVVGGAFVGWQALKLAFGVVRDAVESRGRLMTVFAALCVGALVAAAVVMVRALVGAFGNGSATGGALVWSGLAWPLLIVASAMIRKLLVQFLGDVAIYVAPYRLDAYFQLRDDIKSRVLQVAQAIYAMRDGEQPMYDEVIVVGHSLGSVIVYDTLNRLIRDDAAAHTRLHVRDRTPLLLTFGSPLDKTAFLFGLQANKTDEGREALAAAVQPLIQSYDQRPARWINIHSPWDIISGPLDFYDDPDDPSAPQRVQNVVDPCATTLLAAHVEYWENPLLFETLYAALVPNAP